MVTDMTFHTDESGPRSGHKNLLCFQKIKKKKEKKFATPGVSWFVWKQVDPKRPYENHIKWTWMLFYLQVFKFF